jgi:tetratricopeptide (TPR) repeat protein
MFLNHRLLITIISVFFIIIFLSAAECTAQQDGYFDRIAMVSDGRLTRFTKMPITVYAESLQPGYEEYNNDLIYSLKEWQSQSSGLVSFEIVKNPDGADVLLSWVHKLEANYNELPLGMSQLHRVDRDKFYVEMEICIREPITLKPISDDRMKVVLLHEMGHAIGLWGHSKNKDDVMYYASNVMHPTLSDMIALKTLYSYENNYSFHTQTISTIKNDLETNPSDANSYFLLGSVYLDIGDYNSAIEALRKCLSLNRQYYKARVALASAYKSLGQEESAISEYLSLAQSSPSPMLQNVIGVSYYEHGDVASAIDHFKKALDENRSYEPARRNLYSVYLNNGNELINSKTYDEAIKLLQDGLKIFPDKPEILNTLGVAYSETGRFEEALALYNQAILINPGFTNAKNNMASCYNNLGVKYANLGRWEEANNAYKKASELSPGIEGPKKNISALYWNQALRFVNSGNDKEAVSAYLEFLKREPNSRDGYNNLGAAYSRLKENQSAINALECAFQIDPNSKDIKSNLSLAHQRWGIELLDAKAYNDALMEFNKALEFTPDNSSIHVCIAMVYSKLGKSDQAIQYVNSALNFDPKNENARKILLNIRIQQADRYMQSKDYDKALECLNSLPDDLMEPFLQNNIAYIYIMKGMYVEATNEIDKVLKVDPDDKTANQNLISMETKLKNSLLRNHNSQELKDQLARVHLSIAISYSQKGELLKAKQELKSALDIQPKDSDIRLILSEGCKNLAERFAKTGEKRQSNELQNWANQLNFEE